MISTESILAFRDPPYETTQIKEYIHNYTISGTKGRMFKLYQYFHTYPIEITNLDQMISEGNALDIFTRLDNVTEEINNVYSDVVKREYGNSPLYSMDLPGIHIFIGLFARYFANISSVPFDFHENIKALVPRYDTFNLIDKEYNLPYNLVTRGKLWNDTLLFPYGFNERVGSYYKSDMSNNVHQLDMIVSTLEKNDQLVEHMVRNIIKGRFIVRKYHKNDIINKLIENYLDYRNETVNRFWRARERIYKDTNSKRILNRIIIMLNSRPIKIVYNDNNRTLETVNITADITNFMKRSTGGSLNDELMMKYLGIYRAYVDKINEQIN